MVVELILPSRSASVSTHDLDLASVYTRVSTHRVQLGLRVRCELDTGQYPSGVVVSDAEMATINIKRAELHGDWNYTISPNTYQPNCAFIS